MALIANVALSPKAAPSQPPSCWAQSLPVVLDLSQRVVPPLVVQNWAESTAAEGSVPGHIPTHPGVPASQPRHSVPILNMASLVLFFSFLLRAVCPEPLCTQGQEVVQGM